MAKDKYSAEECEFCQFVAPVIEALDADPTPYESVCGSSAGQQLYGLAHPVDLSFLGDPSPCGCLAGNASNQAQVRPNAASATNLASGEQTVKKPELSYAQVTQMGTGRSVPPYQEAVAIAQPIAQPNQQPEPDVPPNDVSDDFEYSRENLVAAIRIASYQLRPQAAPFIPARLQPTAQPNIEHVMQPVRNQPEEPQFPFALNVAIQRPLGPTFQPFQPFQPIQWATPPSITYIPPQAQQRLNIPQHVPYTNTPSGVATQRPQGPSFHLECGPSHSQPIIQYIRLPMQQQQQQPRQPLRTACEFQWWNNPVSINQATMPQQSASPLMYSHVQQSDPQPSVQLNRMGPPFANGSGMSSSPIGIILPIMPPPTPPLTPTPPPMPRIFVNYVPQPFIQQGNFYENSGPFIRLPD